MAQNDFQMAMLLQQQFEFEAAIESPMNNLTYTKKKSRNVQDNTKSLVDPSWELIDPTPDIHMLFIVFNEKYFSNKLLAVCVDWSKRMTTCAGICSYQGRGGMCRITLSAPLLKLRPRKDLVETLLHEMIHAYLFVTHNNRDRDGHGPEFHKHMYRINSEAGTNITVYHDFHDEVRLYKQHWWRCNGPCQNRKPYFGMVRRATNRAPSPHDFWWGEHQQNCGGTFIKVQEPPKPPSKKKPVRETKSDPNNDIRTFYPVVKPKTSSSTVTSSIDSVDINNKPDSKPSNITGLNNLIGTSTNNTAASSSGKNIVGFKDLTSTRPKSAVSNSSSTIVINKKPSTTKQDTKADPKPNVEQPKPAPIVAFSGTGQSLGNPTSSSSDYDAVRNHWTNKFPNVAKPTKRVSSSSSSSPTSPKRIKPNEEENIDYVTCPVCQKKFPSSEVNAHLDQCLEEQPDVAQPEIKLSKCPICDQTYDLDVINGHVEACLSKVFVDTEEPTDDNFKPLQDLIPCLVCNKQIPRGDLNSHLDECMGGNNIFNNSSGDVDDGDDFNSDTTKSDDKDKKYNCPVCFELFNVNEMTGHLDKCLSSDDEASNSFLDEPF